MGDDVAVLQSEQPPLFFDSKTLVPIEQKLGNAFDFSKLEINQVVQCGDTKTLAIVCADGTAYVLDRRQSDSILMLPIPGLTGVDAAVWDESSGHVWFSHLVDRVSSVDPRSQSIVKQLRPKIVGWRLVDRYVVTPLRTITPQTSELGETIASIVSGEPTMQFPIDTEAAQVERYNVWRPVITCGAFMLVMLSIGCIYFSRSDF